LRHTGNRADFGLPRDYFLFVGRLSPEKNVAGLIDAFSVYRTAGGTASLVLCGDGPSRVDLMAQAETAGVREHVIFAGLKTTPELLPYYAFARVLVLPSKREPWGLVVNEAMASGLPVLVSNRCGCAEDLVRDNGLVFDPDAPDALPRGLSILGATPPCELEALGRRSREIIAQYSPGVWASEVAEFAGDCC
ncbi:MAG TPA: glycosyltransferase family 4 protein, partial [Verrucomicrobiae bacterium]|nr:glycosyltransferase family 4 protein [Verrucomicrobiae bacterium]